MRDRPVAIAFPTRRSSDLHRPSDGDDRTLTSSSLKLRGGFANLTSPPGFSETSLASRETGELYPVLLDETTETCLCTNVTQMGLKGGEAAEVSDGWERKRVR